MPKLPYIKIKLSVAFYLPLSLLFLGLTISHVTLAETTPSSSNNKSQLHMLHQEITSVKSKLSADTKKQATLTELLKISEKNIGQLTLTISQLNTEIKQQEDQIASLENQEKEYKNSLGDQQTTLSALIRANYILQRKGRLGIYFSGNSADKTNRFLTYHQALDNSMIEAIKAQQKTIDNLADVLKKIREKTAALQRKLKTVTAQKQRISQQQNNRQKIIGALNSAIKTSQQKLDQLNTNQKNLSKIVEKLKPNKVKLASLNFAKQQKKLNLPTQGKVNHLFWTPMAGEQIKWQGDLINAPLGTKVHSIYAGKVIYADWLRGYGLLMIIDHGQGYMSLYGRNHVLYRKVGDHVNTGDVIATVGESGGFKTPALYFEIRHDSTSLNPSNWVK